MSFPIGHDARQQVEAAFGFDMDCLSPGEAIHVMMHALDALFGEDMGHAHALARAGAFAREHSCIFFSGEATQESPRFERLNLDRSLATEFPIAGASRSWSILDRRVSRPASNSPLRSTALAAATALAQVRRVQDACRGTDVDCYRVRPNLNGWSVSFDGDEVATFESQDEAAAHALAMGRALANRLRNAVRVVVAHVDGTESEVTFDVS